MVLGNAESRKRLTQVRTDLIERRCAGCHADFDIKPAMTDAQKDEAALRFMLAQDAWVYPGMPEAGRMHERVWGKGAGRIMPANGAQLLASEAIGERWKRSTRSSPTWCRARASASERQRRS